MPRIYLSYAMEKADLAATKLWADNMIKQLTELGYSVFNPLDGECTRLFQFDINSIDEFHELKTKNLPKFLEIMSYLRETDVTELLDSDIVVVKLDKNLYGGSGVAGELTLATVFGLPVFGVLEEKDIPIIPSWLLSCVKYDYLFTNEEACIAEIKRNPIQSCWMGL